MLHRISPPCRSLAVVLVLACAITGAACGQGAPADAPPADAPVVAAPAEVSPESAPPAAESAPSPAETTAAAADDDHAGHVHRAPNGGTLLELGDHMAQLEMKLDRATGQIHLWVFDGHAERPIRLTNQTIAIIVDAPAPLANRPLELAAQANTLTGERVGDTSEFAFVHEALRGVDHIAGRVIEVTVRGATFRDVAFDVPAARPEAAHSRP